MASVPPIEYVKLIPADSIPVFCFNENLLDSDMESVRQELQRFFGKRKFLAIRAGDMQIYAIADRDSVSAEGASWAMEGTKWL